MKTFKLALIAGLIACLAFPAMAREHKGKKGGSKHKKPVMAWKCEKTKQGCPADMEKRLAEGLERMIVESGLATPSAAQKAGKLERKVTPVNEEETPAEQDNQEKPGQVQTGANAQPTQEGMMGEEAQPVQEEEQEVLQAAPVQQPADYCKKHCRELHDDELYPAEIELQILRDSIDPTASFDRYPWLLYEHSEGCQYYQK